jgi:hypothetical protein
MSWRLARSLETLRDEVRTRWPGTTIWALGDPAHAARPSDHNPSPSPNRVVCAIDIVGKPQAQAVWNLIASTRPERVKYMIFNRQIMSPPGWQARRYTGKNGHLDHVHVSVGRGPDGSGGRPDLYDDRSAWFAKRAVPVTAPPPPAPKDDVMTPAQEAKLDRLAADLAALSATVGDRVVGNDLRRLRLGLRALLTHFGIKVDGGP